MYVLWLLTDCEGWGLSLMMKEQVLRFQHKYSSPQPKKTSFGFYRSNPVRIYFYTRKSWCRETMTGRECCIIVTPVWSSQIISRVWPVTSWLRDTRLSHFPLRVGADWYFVPSLSSGPDDEKKTQAEKHSRVIKQSDVACFVCVLNISSLCPFCLLVDRDPMYVFTHNITFNRSIDIQISHTLLSLQNISVQENLAEFVTKDSELM